MSKIPTSAIKEHELLACYVTGEEDLVLNGDQVKGDIFVPTPNSHRANRLEKSVIRYGDRTLDQMQIAGKSWASSCRKAYIGLAEVSAGNVKEIRDLDLEHTPRRWDVLHSDIVNWLPQEPRYRIQAELIARKSTFFRG